MPSIQGTRRMKKFDKSTRIIKAIEKNVMRLLTELNSRNLVMELKFYEILRSMQMSKTARNEREIFYMSVSVFGKQTSVGRLVKKISSELQVSRTDLGIRNTLKGIFVGKLTFMRNSEGSVYSVESDSGNSQLIPDMSDIVDVFCSHTMVVVVEKDTVLSRAAAMKEEWILDKVLFVCGKGYPCRNTMMLLKILEKKMKIFGLFDFDPFGIHIYTVYKYGSAETPSLRIESIERIGIGVDDTFCYGVSKNDLVILNKHDFSMIERLMKYEELVEDLVFLRNLGRKLEIEACFSREKNSFESFLYRKLLWKPFQAPNTTRIDRIIRKV